MCTSKPSLLRGCILDAVIRAHNLEQIAPGIFLHAHLRMTRKRTPRTLAVAVLIPRRGIVRSDLDLGQLPPHPGNKALAVFARV